MSAGEVHRFETDVLVIGGGMAGVFAAIHAREYGVEVTVIDKAAFGRGGCAALASGVYAAYMPGDSLEDWMRGSGGMIDQELLSRAVPHTH